MTDSNREHAPTSTPLIDVPHSARMLRRLKWLWAMPIVTVLFIGLTLGFLIHRIRELAARVAQADEILATANFLQERILDDEIDSDGVVLINIPRARAGNDGSAADDALLDLRRLVNDRDQSRRIDELELRLDRWRSSVKRQNLEEDGDWRQQRQRRQESARRMDEVRVSLASLIEAESSSRSALAEAASSSLAITQLVLFVVVCCAILLLAFLSQRQLGLVANSYSAALVREREARVEYERQRDELKKKCADELAHQNNLISLRQSLDAEIAMSAQRSEELTRAYCLVSERTYDVEIANRYKAEFLVNVSHELLTPLNSVLVMSRLLADNTEKNLSREQISFAETIFSSGHTLLGKINDILDLSNLEDGKADVHVTDVRVTQIADRMRRQFEGAAQGKHLGFQVVVDRSAPALLETDPQRLEQVVMNLLSNAIKYTHTGAILLHVSGRDGRVCFSVTDSGIGIRQDQLAVIFEPFRQADGSATRRYGGTGLGLSISRDLAILLGGELTAESVPNLGSTFTLSIPLQFLWLDIPISSSRRVEVAAPLPQIPSHTLELTEGAPAYRVVDDRGHLDPEAKVVLIVEHVTELTTTLVELAREMGFQCVVARSMEEGLELAGSIVPSAILLDAHLPDQSGMSGLERLKRNPITRHIPVHITSSVNQANAALSMGALGYSPRSAPREELIRAFSKIEQHLASGVRRLLIVQEDAIQREGLSRLLGSSHVETVMASTVDDAMFAIGNSSFDCVITDLALVDDSGRDLLERMSEDTVQIFPPVIVYTGRSLNAAQEARTRSYSRSVIVKGIRSPERLLDAATLFLHQVEADLPPDRQRMLTVSRDRTTRFDGRQILIVEDDVRSVFELTNTLESKGVKVVIARNGREALEVLERTPGVDLALMDIVMPEMDGLAATRSIRQQGRWSNLPIILLTLAGEPMDQESYRNAGANDFITKPLDAELLFSLLRVWLPTLGVQCVYHGATIAREDTAATEAWSPMSPLGRDAVPLNDSAIPVVKILAVDDHDDNLVALEALLRRDGLEILLAHSGTEALELLLVHDVALALLDVQMPDMDGFTLAELMRGSERTRHVPIIFITAGGHDKNRAFRGYDAGAVDFLFKPIDSRILRHKTDTFVQLFRQHQMLANRLKLNETFIATVGHDLRTPLNVIMMSAAMIRDDTSEAATRRAAERMVSSGRRMANMIDDLFDLARVRLGTGLSIVRMHVDLATTVRRVVTEFETTDPDRVIERTQTGDTTGEWDDMRCEQMVANLIANALSHGDRTKPVCVSLTGARDEVVLCVKNGGTIPPDELDHLFDPFRTAHGSKSRSQGLGLGLYIVQQLVLAHQGTISVTSTAEGTSFKVGLPRLG